MMSIAMFSIFQGFLSVLAMAVIALAGFAAFACAAALLRHLRKPKAAAPREPVKLRLVKPGPEPERDPDQEEWLKDFG
jgi:hypothetical protein